MRIGGAAGGAAPRTPADLAAASDGPDRLSAETPIALSEAGPFTPLATAVRQNGALRDVLARDIAIPSLGDHRRIRMALGALAALPMALLLELDGELAFAGRTGPGRIGADVVLVAWVVFELSRSTPRMPRVAATCLAAIALRWALVIARACGHGVHPVFWAAAGLATAGAALFLARVPPRERVVLELLGKLGVSRSQLFAATARKEAPGALVAAAIACAAGLPAVLALVRAAGAGLFVQACAFVLFAALAPIGARRLGEAPDEAATPAAGAPPVPRIVLAFAIGLALTAAAVTAGRLFFDAGAELARCVNRLDAEAKLARATEAAELARAIAKVRGSAPLVVMTAAVFPFAEERVYRGLLQDVLSRKYGEAYGLFAASLAFGVAHLGVYEVALYQTVLLGVGFGVAFSEGGLLAAFLVHATWNLMQMG